MTKQTRYDPQPDVTKWTLFSSEKQEYLQKWSNICPYIDTRGLDSEEAWGT